jgi:hypothetical protein
MKLEKIKPRNWVAKNNRCRSARHRDHTQYQRHNKHRNKEDLHETKNLRHSSTSGW